MPLLCRPLFRVAAILVLLTFIIFMIFVLFSCSYPLVTATTPSCSSTALSVASIRNLTPGQTAEAREKINQVLAEARLGSLPQKRQSQQVRGPQPYRTTPAPGQRFSPSNNAPYGNKPNNFLSNAFQSLNKATTEAQRSLMRGQSNSWNNSGNNNVYNNSVRDSQPPRMNDATTYNREYSDIYDNGNSWNDSTRSFAQMPNMASASSHWIYPNDEQPENRPASRPAPMPRTSDLDNCWIYPDEPLENKPSASRPAPMPRTSGTANYWEYSDSQSENTPSANPWNSPNREAPRRGDETNQWVYPDSPSANAWNSQSKATQSRQQAYFAERIAESRQRALMGDIRSTKQNYGRTMDRLSSTPPSSNRHDVATPPLSPEAAARQRYFAERIAESRRRALMGDIVASRGGSSTTMPSLQRQRNRNQSPNYRSNNNHYRNNNNNHNVLETLQQAFRPFHRRGVTSNLPPNRQRDLLNRIGSSRSQTTTSRFPQPVASRQAHFSRRVAEARQRAAMNGTRPIY